MPPSGFDIMSTLLQLLAEQEGLKITYTMTDGKTTVRKTTGEEGEEKWANAS